MVRWMSGLVPGLQNRSGRFDSATHLYKPLMNKENEEPASNEQVLFLVLPVKGGAGLAGKPRGTR